MKEAVRRLHAYAEAGADVLYAPGVYLPEEIGTIVAEVAPKPVNVLVGWSTPVTVGDLAALGVRRISVGSALARAAWAGFMRAAQALSEEGSFAGFEGLVGFADINNIFRE